jgi:hypothetical protein
MQERELLSTLNPTLKEKSSIKKWAQQSFVTQNGLERSLNGKEITGGIGPHPLELFFRNLCGNLVAVICTSGILGPQLFRRANLYLIL